MKNFDRLINDESFKFEIKISEFTRHTNSVMR